MTITPSQHVPFDDSREEPELPIPSSINHETESSDEDVMNHTDEKEVGSDESFQNNSMIKYASP